MAEQYPRPAIEATPQPDAAKRDRGPKDPDLRIRIKDLAQYLGCSASEASAAARKFRGLKQSTGDSKYKWVTATTAAKVIIEVRCAQGAVFIANPERLDQLDRIRAYDRARNPLRHPKKPRVYKPGKPDTSGPVPRKHRTFWKRPSQAARWAK